jgi:hypothetical protein
VTAPPIEAEPRQFRRHLERSHIELTALNAQLEHAAREWRTTVDMIDASLIVLEPAGAILRMNLAAAATLPDGLSAWLGRPSVQLQDRQPWASTLVLAGESSGRGSNLRDAARARHRRGPNLGHRLPSSATAGSVERS